MATRTRESLSYYLSLNYPFSVDADPDGGYVITFPDLPGCMTQVESTNEIGPAAEEVRRLWITTEHEAGEDIPAPSYPEEYSGKFNLRLPRSLHRRLAELAERENVSLNQCVVTLLARAESESRMRASKAFAAAAESELVPCITHLLGRLALRRPVSRDKQASSRFSRGAHTDSDGSVHLDESVHLADFLRHCRDHQPTSVEDLPQSHQSILRNTLAHPKRSALYRWLTNRGAAPQTDPWSPSRSQHWLRQLKREAEQDPTPAQRRR